MLGFVAIRCELSAARWGFSDPRLVLVAAVVLLSEFGEVVLRSAYADFCWELASSSEAFGVHRLLLWRARLAIWGREFLDRFLGWSVLGVSFVCVCVCVLFGI